MLVCFDGPLLEFSAPLPTLNPRTTSHYVFMYTKANTNAYTHRLKEFHFKTDMLYLIISSNSIFFLDLLPVIVFIRHSHYPLKCQNFLSVKNLHTQFSISMFWVPPTESSQPPILLLKAVVVNWEEWYSNQSCLSVIWKWGLVIDRNS